MHPPTTSTSYSNYDSLMGSVAIPGDEADADSSRNSQLRAAPNSAGKRAQRRLFASTNDVHSPEHLQRLLTWIETKGEESEAGCAATEVVQALLNLYGEWTRRRTSCDEEVLVAEICKSISQLVDDGHLYTTIDQYHFKAT